MIKVKVIGWMGKQSFRLLENDDPFFAPTIYEEVGDPCDWSRDEYPPVKVELKIEEIKDASIEQTKT